VTQELGIQFLWIDSICIIQDREDSDLRFECGLMDKYFASAYCTLAATSAKDCEGGLFLGRALLRISDGTAGIYVGDIPEDNFDRDVNSTDLNQRGWVLQERILSPRTIHFTKSQMYWECGSQIRCETLNNIDSTFNWLGDSYFPWGASHVLRGLKGYIFREVFSRYSKLDLTESRNKPLAILGLETRLAEFYGTPSTNG
ncbi:hypothetical protein GQ44DRAFT_597390, partial [Phaeosphaeriaceae sp. PMI808]